MVVKLFLFVGAYFENLVIAGSKRFNELHRQSLRLYLFQVICELFRLAISYCRAQSVLVFLVLVFIYECEFDGQLAA